MQPSSSPPVGRIAFGPSHLVIPPGEVDKFREELRRQQGNLETQLARPADNAVNGIGPTVTRLDNTDLEFWADLIDKASRRVSDAKWYRGDILVEMRRVLGSRWTQVLDLERLKVKDGKLRQELWISSKFPDGQAREGRRRMPVVDWGQHRLVAADDIPARDAMLLLGRSAAEGWSYSRMEAEVRTLRGQTDDAGDVPDPTTVDRREYVTRVVASRCPDVAALDRRLVLSAAFAAQEEWERAQGSRTTRVAGEASA